MAFEKGPDITPENSPIVEVNPNTEPKPETKNIPEKSSKAEKTDVDYEAELEKQITGEIEGGTSKDREIEDKLGKEVADAVTREREAEEKAKAERAQKDATRAAEDKREQESINAVWKRRFDEDDAKRAEKAVAKQAKVEARETKKAEKVKIKETKKEFKGKLKEAKIDLKAHRTATKIEETNVVKKTTELQEKLDKTFDEQETKRIEAEIDEARKEAEVTRAVEELSAETGKQVYEPIIKAERAEDEDARLGVMYAERARKQLKEDEAAATEEARKEAKVTAKEEARIMKVFAKTERTAEKTKTVMAEDEARMLRKTRERVPEEVAGTLAEKQTARLEQSIRLAEEAVRLAPRSSKELAKQHLEDERQRLATWKERATKEQLEVGQAVEEASKIAEESIVRPFKEEAEVQEAVEELSEQSKEKVAEDVLEHDNAVQEAIKIAEESAVENIEKEPAPKVAVEQAAESIVTPEAILQSINTLGSDRVLSAAREAQIARLGIDPNSSWVDFISAKQNLDSVEFYVRENERLSGGSSGQEVRPTAQEGPTRIPVIRMEGGPTPAGTPVAAPRAEQAPVSSPTPRVEATPPTVAASRVEQPRVAQAPRQEAAPAVQAGAERGVETRAISREEVPREAVRRVAEGFRRAGEILRTRGAEIIAASYVEGSDNDPYVQEIKKKIEKAMKRKWWNPIRWFVGKNPEKILRREFGAVEGGGGTISDARKNKLSGLFGIGREAAAVERIQEADPIMRFVTASNQDNLWEALRRDRVQKFSLAPDTKWIDVAKAMDAATVNTGGSTPLPTSGQASTPETSPSPTSTTPSPTP